MKQVKSTITVFLFVIFFMFTLLGSRLVGKILNNCLVISGALTVDKSEMIKSLLFYRDQAGLRNVK